MIGLAHQFLCTNASNKVAEFAESNMYYGLPYILNMYGHHIFLCINAANKIAEFAESNNLKTHLKEYF